MRCLYFCKRYRTAVKQFLCHQTKPTQCNPWIDPNLSKITRICGMRADRPFGAPHASVNRRPDPPVDVSIGCCCCCCCRRVRDVTMTTWFTTMTSPLVTWSACRRCRALMLMMMMVVPSDLCTVQRSASAETGHRTVPHHGNNTMFQRALILL